MANVYPPTIIVRDAHENPKKCSILPLQARADLVFLLYPVSIQPSLDNYVRLGAHGPPLTVTDAPFGLLLLDGSWRRADSMTRTYSAVPARSLHDYQTAYPRVSKRGDDPCNGLASVEALYIAYHILGRPTTGLLDHYRWRDAFLSQNAAVLDGTTERST